MDFRLDSCPVLVSLSLACLVGGGTRSLDAQAKDRWLHLSTGASGFQLDTMSIATKEGHFLVWMRQPTPAFGGFILAHEEVDCHGLGYRLLEVVSVNPDGERHRMPPTSTDWYWIAPDDGLERTYRNACVYLRRHAPGG